MAFEEIEAIGNAHVWFESSLGLLGDRVIARVRY